MNKQTLSKVVVTLLFFYIGCCVCVRARLLDALSEESVVVITGAAGFLGSELALALYRTYNPRKIICIDSMDGSDKDLALFEFKRQRVFHLLQNVPHAEFYRVDFRPAIPEYYDTGEVPILANIFEMNPDITHIVHLAAPHKPQQVIHRRKGEVKAGMLESILEQIHLFETQHGRQPHLVYASSSEVYNHRPDATLATTSGEAEDKQDDHDEDLIKPPFREESPITVPSTIVGAAKLIDEIIALTYYELHDIFSIGLRFFSVYGPWGVPGSPLFEMAERLVAGKSPILPQDMDDVRDFLYVDDALNAVMSAMQFRPIGENPRPIVINVGSGEGTTLRALAKSMVKLVPVEIDAIPRKPPTVSFASTVRAQHLLRFSPLVSIEEGLERLLAWHYDRAYPYGAKPRSTTLADLADKGFTQCSRYDVECLKGTPVFPCASECAHETQCLPTFWDDVVDYSKALTSGCHTVLYTVALESNLALLPSTVVRVSEKSKPSAECNIAFVNEASPLYQLLKKEPPPIKHGFWHLVPVRINNEPPYFMKVLPKLSPSLFFSVAIREAIYSDPDVIFHSIPRIVREASLQPYNSYRIRGSTAVLIGQRSADFTYTRWNSTRLTDQVQQHAYRMMRMTLMDALAPVEVNLLDASFVVHALANDDARLFRCDAYGEVLQWDASEDEPALEFILSLHDLWSRILAQKQGKEPWWVGADVKTVDHKGNLVVQQDHRRLQEERQPSQKSNHRRLQEEIDPAIDDGAADDAVVGDTQHNGFGIKEANKVGQQAGPSEAQQRHKNPVDDEFDFGDDWMKQMPDLPLMPKTPTDPSSYDVWMGILSSTALRSFARIVNPEAVGAVHIDNYAELAFATTAKEF